MPNRPINIEGINPSDNSLILSDNGHTTANPSDTVTWNIMNNSGVASITSIIDNSTVDIFSPDPAVGNNNSSWQGTVNPGITTSTQETYTINYTKTGSNQTYRFDPIIQVNPK
jgi:hypothetical protein